MLVGLHLLNARLTDSLSANLPPLFFDFHFLGVPNAGMDYMVKRPRESVGDSGFKSRFRFGGIAKFVWPMVCRHACEFSESGWKPLLRVRSS